MTEEQHLGRVSIPWQEAEDKIENKDPNHRLKSFYS